MAPAAGQPRQQNITRGLQLPTQAPQALCKGDQLFPGLAEAGNGPQQDGLATYDRLSEAGAGQTARHLQLVHRHLPLAAGVPAAPF